MLIRPILSLCAIPLRQQIKMATGGSAVDWKNAGSIYEFSAKDIDGNEVSMDKYRGKVVMIINVACK